MEVVSENEVEVSSHGGSIGSMERRESVGGEVKEGACVLWALQGGEIEELEGEEGTV